MCLIFPVSVDDMLQWKTEMTEDRLQNHSSDQGFKHNTKQTTATGCICLCIRCTEGNVHLA